MNKEGHESKLRDWILAYYGNTVFNNCEHSKLPQMTGTLLEFHINPAAKPVACHKIAPVPLHWKTRVKADPDRDVALGVLERLPDNKPLKWLSRMVIADYQPLNRHSTRQTFPIQSILFHRAVYAHGVGYR